MKTKQNLILKTAILTLLGLPLLAWSQAQDTSQAGDDKAAAAAPAKAQSKAHDDVQSEVSAGLYYLDDDSYRYGKFTGLVDEGIYAYLDFRVEKRPEWNSGDTTRWRVQGWRLGLDSRRLEFDYNDPVKQTFNADYREIPNYRFSDGQTPYLDSGESVQTLPSTWAITPGSNNTRGFLTLSESLNNLKVDTKRRWLDMNYALKLSANWNMTLSYDYISKKGERTIGSIFGNTGGNPRAVILAAPVDYMTNNFEGMFNYTTAQAQFGFGFFASFFNNDDTSLTWQNAYGVVTPGWAPSVTYPGSQGRLALEPDNSYWQIKAYGAWNFAPSTRLSVDASYGQMKQNDSLQPYSVNPNLIVHTPVPLESLDGKVDTTMFNARFTSQLARPLGLAMNYIYNDRNNKTPRAVYPYIGGDSENQKAYELGRINLPYSYTKQQADAALTYRIMSGIRLKGGVEYYDTSRDYSEVADSNEWAWLAGVKFGGFETSSFNVDYRNSSRDVDAYIGNTPLIDSHLPGVIAEDEFENNPLLRKYYLTDRDRQEFRFRADVFPVPEWNVGLALSYFKDDYDEGYFGLNEAKVKSGTIDAGWYPVPSVAFTGYYTIEKYDASQSSRAFSNAAQAADPLRNWFADTTDEVDTWNLAVTFSEIGSSHGWKDINLGFDYTSSDTNSQIDVTAVTLVTAPLPPLVARLTSFSAWLSFAVGSNSDIRLTLEHSELTSTDFGLDNVVPNTMANVLSLGESAANYDIFLATGYWTYHF